MTMAPKRGGIRPTRGRGVSGRGGSSSIGNHVHQDSSRQSDISASSELEPSTIPNQNDMRREREGQADPDTSAMSASMLTPDQEGPRRQGERERDADLSTSGNSASAPSRVDKRSSLAQGGRGSRGRGRVAGGVKKRPSTRPGNEDIQREYPNRQTFSPTDRFWY